MANINWQNLPSETTPINSTNLNVMSAGLLNVSNEADDTYRVNLLGSKNLFNKDNIDGYVGLNATLTTTSNGVKATATTTGQYLQAIVIIKDATNMVGESVSVKGNFTASSSNTGRITIGLCDNEGGNRNGLVHITTSGNSGNATIPSISGDAKYLFIAFYANNDGTGATNTYVDYTNVMLNLGSTALPYEAFIQNQLVVDNEKYSDTLNVGQFDSRSRVNVLKSKNLYNSNSMPLTNGLWYNGSNAIGTNSGGWYVIVPITGGKTYTISKKNVGRIYTTTTSSYPANGVATIDTWGGGADLTTRTITTSSNAKYLFIGLLIGTSPTENEKAQAIEELQIEENSTKTSYEPYVVPSIYVDNEVLVSKNVYSTGEVVIGEWLGKPLYRKVVTISSLPNNTNVEYDIFSNTSEINECWVDVGMSYVSLSNNSLKYPVNWIWTTSAYMFTGMNGKKLRVKTTENQSANSGYFVINYTKN